MDATFQKRNRMGLLTDLDYQRMGIPTPAEAKKAREEKYQERRLSRIMKLMEHSGMWDSGEFYCYDGLAAETDELTVAGNWNDEYRNEFVGPIHPGWNNWYEWKIGPNPPGQPSWASWPRRNVLVNDWPSRILALLERIGVNTVWSDMYMPCDCGKGWLSNPNFGEAHGWIGDGDYMCIECYDETRCEDCGQPFAHNCNGFCHQWDEDSYGPCCHCGCEEDESEDEND